MHDLQELFLRDVRRPLDEGALESDPGAAAHLVIDIGATGTILTDQNRGQMGRRVPGRDPISHLVRDFPLDGLRQGLAV